MIGRLLYVFFSRYYHFVHVNASTPTSSLFIVQPYVCGTISLLFYPDLRLSILLFVSYLFISESRTPPNSRLHL